MQSIKYEFVICYAKKWTYLKNVNENTQKPKFGSPNGRRRMQWTQTPSPDLEFKLINDCRHKRDVDAINWLDWWFNVFKMVWNLFLSNALDLLGTYAYCVICNY